MTPDGNPPEVRILAYTKGKMSELLRDSPYLNITTQMVVYPGVTHESVEKYNKNDDAIGGFEIESKLMLKTDQMHDTTFSVHQS